jgi:hypothetical protein
MSHKWAGLSKILETTEGIIFRSCISPIHRHASSEALRFLLAAPLSIDKLNLYYNLEFVLIYRKVQVSFSGKHYNSIILKTHLQVEASL